MSPKRGDLVHVTTHDIEHGNAGWQSIKSVIAIRPTRFHAVGWVIKASKRTLTIAAMTAPGSAFCYYRLPRGGITRIRRLK